MMLAHESRFSTHFPAGEQAGIGVIDLCSHNAFSIVGHTRAWNWQQGAMLQWLPTNPNRSILYNDRVGDSFVTVVLDIQNGSRRILPRATAALSHSGRMALSINFSRLYNLRKDYGYAGVPDPWHKELYPDDDGIYLMNMDTGAHKMILSIRQVVRFDPCNAFARTHHWINHLAFNPDDSRFCFLHRFRLPYSKQFGTRLFTSNLDGTDLRCLWSNHVSHFDWRDPDHVLAWATRKRESSIRSRLKQHALFLLKRARPLYRKLKMQPFLRTRVYGGAFFLFTDTVSDGNVFEEVGQTSLTEDGHCSYSPDRKWILLDTYPDAHNNRRIFIYNIADKKHVGCGVFRSPPNMRDELRCDLHPRWDRSGTRICFDSMHEGTRQMYVMDVSSITL